MALLVVTPEQYQDGYKVMLPWGIIELKYQLVRRLNDHQYLVLVPEKETCRYGRPPVPALPRRN